MTEAAAVPPPGGGLGGGPIGKPRAVGMQILFAIITLGIYTYFWVYWQHKEMKEYSGAGVGGAVGVIIYFFVNPVTWFLIPAELNALYKRDGRGEAMSIWNGLWFLLPIIGAFVWFFKVQPAINEYWESKGAPPPA